MDSEHSDVTQLSALGTTFRFHEKWIDHKIVWLAPSNKRGESGNRVGTSWQTFRKFHTAAEALAAWKFLCFLSDKRREFDVQQDEAQNGRAF